MGEAISNLAKSFGFGNNDGDDAAKAVAANNALGQAELKKQYQETKGNLDPYITAGSDALGNVVKQSSAGGMDEIFKQIFGTDMFKNLLEQRTRSVEGQLSAGGLTRSGTGVQAAASIPTDLALKLSDLIFGRQSGLSTQGLHATNALGNFGQNTASNIATLHSDTGQAAASGILTDAQAKAKGQENLQETTTSVAKAYFGGSDPILKENAEVIGKIKDLNLYQWDWKEPVKKTFIGRGPTIGFMADEVREIYPQFVGELGGIMFINYGGLLDELEAA